MHSTHIPFEVDLSLFYQATHIPFCVFDNTSEVLLCYPLVESMTYSPIILEQYHNTLEHIACSRPLLFSSDNFFFALLKLNETTNIILGPVLSVPLTYKEFYAFNKEYYNPDVLTYLYCVIRQSPHISLSQFAANISLFIKLIFKESISVQDVLTAQLEIPKKNCSSQMSEITNPHYTSVSEAISFEKIILYHIRSGNLEEIKRIFHEPNFFNCSEYIFSSADAYYQISFVYTTLCCITAIEEGIDPQKAFLIFNTFISKIPTISSQTDMAELCMNISIEYCLQIISLHEYQSTSPVITQCLQYIHEHLHSKITISDLAIHCNLSKRSITRHFTTHYHMTVTEYILTEKLKRAAVLLSTSAFSLTEISHQLAFSSQSHFSVAFKKKYFYTPQQYRNKFRHSLHSHK